MKPVTVSVTVPNSREEVYDFLDVLANHEPFTDHMMVDWQYSGPAAGIGARARMRLKKPGRADWMDLEIVEVHPPTTSVEETLGAGGRRHARHVHPRRGPGGRDADLLPLRVAACAAGRAPGGPGDALGAQAREPAVAGSPGAAADAARAAALTCGP